VKLVAKTSLMTHGTHADVPPFNSTRDDSRHALTARVRQLSPEQRRSLIARAQRRTAQKAEPEPEVIRVLYAVDDGYTIPLSASVRSLVDNAKCVERLEIVVLTSGMSEASRERLFASWRDRVKSVTFIPVDTAPFHNLPTSSPLMSHPSEATYARFLAPDLLPATWDRVVYLDADTISTCSLEPLWTTDLRGAAVAAVQDPVVPYVSSRFGLPGWRQAGLEAGTRYFNSGVMLVNLEAWRREQIAERSLAYLQENRDRIVAFEQEALNFCVRGRFVQLDPVWNVMHNYWSNPVHRVGKYSRILERARIHHFAGAEKPWSPGNREAFGARLFFDYLDRTRWQGWRPQ
jgi:lipopolysaccharide biosynthesis glycosyltransferase